MAGMHLSTYRGTERWVVGRKGVKRQLEKDDLALEKAAGHRGTSVWPFFERITVALRGLRFLWKGL